MACLYFRPLKPIGLGSKIGLRNRQYLSGDRKKELYLSRNFCDNYIIRECQNEMSAQEAKYGYPFTENHRFPLEDHPAFIIRRRLIMKPMSSLKSKTQTRKRSVFCFLDHQSFLRGQQSICVLGSASGRRRMGGPVRIR